MIGRGFGLMHERVTSPPSTRRRTRGRWTTRRTAGSGCRRRCGCASVTRRARGVGGRGGVPDGVGVGAAGPLADGRAGARGSHRDLQWRRPSALRRSRRRLQPARRADRPRRSRPECLHRNGFSRSRPGLHRGTRASAPRDRPRESVGARRCAAGRRVGAGRGPASGGCVAGACHRRIGPRGRRGLRRRRPRRLRDRRRPEGAAGAGALRIAHRRGAQPRNARIRRRPRRHPAHLADAVMHRLAVGHLDRPASAHRARRVQLPAAALDAHLRVRGRLR